jgi:hypothetical protein
VKVNRWLRTMSRCLLALMTGILVVVPSHYEIEFVRSFYSNSPAFCMLFLIAVVALVIITVWLARPWPNENQQEKPQAFSKRGTL